MIALLLLAACAAEDDPTTERAPELSADASDTNDQTPTTDPADDMCGAGDYEGLVGANLAAVTLPEDLGARVIGPDTAVTQEFRPGRLNIHTDEDGTITELTCG